MASLSIAAASTGRTIGPVGRALVLFAASLVLCGAILVIGAGAAAGLDPTPAGQGPGPAGQAAAQQAPPVDAREFGIPLALLAGIGIFLVISSQAGSQASKLADAPLRPRGTLRFPEMDR